MKTMNETLAELVENSTKTKFGKVGTKSYFMECTAANGHVYSYIYSDNSGEDLSEDEIYDTLYDSFLVEIETDLEAFFEWDEFIEKMTGNEKNECCNCKKKEKCEEEIADEYEEYLLTKVADNDKDDKDDKEKIAKNKGMKFFDNYFIERLCKNWDIKNTGTENKTNNNDKKKNILNYFYQNVDKELNEFEKIYNEYKNHPEDFFDDLF